MRYELDSFPDAERGAQEKLAIPLDTQMTDDQIDPVSSGVRGSVALAEIRR